MSGKGDRAQRRGPGKRVRRPPPALAPRQRKRLALLLVLLFLALSLPAALLPQTQPAIQTAALMPAIFGAPTLSPVSGARRIVVSTLTLDGTAPAALLHVYRPSAGRHPALVVSLGLDPAPPDDPRVVALLDGLAHDGIVAALVESPALDAGTLLPDAPDTLVAAFETIARQPSVDAGRVGFLGLSVGGSLALLAAGDPRIAARVRLVEAFGAYAGLDRLARAALTGTIETGSGTEPWQADPLTLSAVRGNLIALLAPAAEQPLLVAALDSDAAGGSLPAAPPAGLSQTGRTVFRLLTAPSGSAFDAALASLSSGQVERIAQLSPLNGIARLRAPVYLMVDEHDPLIPYTESVALAGAIAASGGSVYLSRFDLFRHVEPAHVQPSAALVRDLLRLFWQIQVVLRRLDGG